MKIKLVLLCLIFCITGCFKHQDHNITEPETPRYLLSGTITDMDSDEILQGISVSVSPMIMLYGNEAEPQLVLTDSIGQFAIDPVYPGSYTIEFQRNGAWICSNQIQVEHENKEYNVKLPQIISGRLIPFSMLGHTDADVHRLHRFPAFCFAGTEIIFNAKKIRDKIIETEEFCIAKNSHNKWSYERSLPNNYAEKIKSLSRSTTNILVALKTDSVIFLDKFSGSVVRGKSLTHNMVAVTNDKNRGDIFAASTTTVYKYDATMENLVQTWLNLSENIKAMAFKEHLFIHDNSDHVLREYNSDMQVVASYAIVNASTFEHIPEIFDMDFDGYGNLWVSTP